MKNILLKGIWMVVAAVVAAGCLAQGGTALAADKVVVIPLKSQTRVVKEMYVPASMFRPVTSMLGGTWLQDGAVIKPSGAGYWTAPLLLATGTTVVSLELFWKNAAYNAGQSYVIFHLFNLDNGNGLQLATMSSGVAEEGVQQVKLDAINFSITDNFKPSILVYLGNSNRLLMGVKVVYREG